MRGLHGRLLEDRTVNDYSGTFTCDKCGDTGQVVITAEAYKALRVVREQRDALLATLRRLGENRDICLCDDLYKADQPCDCCIIATAIANAEKTSE